MKIRMIIAMIIFCSMMPASEGYPFSISITEWGNVVKWDKTNVSYYVDADGVDDITDGSDVQAVKDSFKGWSDAACTSLTFTYAGSTTNTSLIPITSKTNGKNELVWIENSQWEFGTYTLGVTSPVYYYDGKIFEADIAFNGYLQKWSTKLDYNKVDVMSVAIHEIGHLFGLQHVLEGYFNPGDPPTMAPYVDPFGNTRSLEDDDKKGVCFLYPKSSYTCSSNTDCPYVLDVKSNGEEYYTGQLKCESSKCGGLSQTLPGSKPLGSSCLESKECKEGLFCQQALDSKKYCSQFCDPAKSDCPTGFECVEFTNESNGACLPKPPEEKKKEGDSCVNSYQCETSFCYPNPDSSGSQCRVACKKGGNACPEGYYCYTYYSSSSGACLPGTNKKEAGEVCNDDNECESGICYSLSGSKICRNPCSPYEQNCSEGYYCMDLGMGTGACMPGEKPAVEHEAGEPCSKDDECKTKFCYAAPWLSQKICRYSCVSDDPQCPEGYACMDFTNSGYGGCLPDKGATLADCSAAGPDDCTAQICIKVGDENPYCTELCKDGNCPSGMTCYAVDPFGQICIKEDTQTDDITPIQEDASISEEETNEETGGNQEDISSENSVKKGGCSLTSFAYKGTGFEFLFIILIFAFAGARLIVPITIRRIHGFDKSNPFK